MAQPELNIHSGAAAKLKAAHDWYHERSPLAADAFIAEIYCAVDLMVEVPNR